MAIPCDYTARKAAAPALECRTRDKAKRVQTVQPILKVCLGRRKANANYSISESVAHPHYARLLNDNRYPIATSLGLGLSSKASLRTDVSRSCLSVTHAL